nr:MAG TPA: reticulocyte binding/rhoptry protein [Caudoviricetes sp.]
MKKLIKLEFDNTTRERKTEDSYSELYSYDKNNGSFEFEILNDTLTTEQVIALFKFTESNKIWKTTGTVEGNKVKVTFDTTLITQNETVICYLYFDEEQRTSDTFRFKFKVKVSEIDKMNRYEVKERFINNTVIVDRLDVVTKDELKEALKNVGGVATEGLLTEVKAEEIYAKKTDAVDNTNFELVKNRVLALELKTDKDTVYDDTPLKERVTALESKAIEGGAYDDSDLRNRVVALEAKHDNDTIYDDTEVKRRLTEIENKPAVDTSVFVTEEKLNEKGYLTEHQDLTPYALKSEIPTPYNDTPLTERVTALENRPTTGGSVDTSNLATKEELAKAVTKDELEAKNYVTEDELNNKGYLTTHQSLDNLVTKEELSTKGYLTEEVLNSKNYLTEDVLNTKNYLTQHQDLSSLVTKQELENKQYLTQHQPLTHLATTSDLEALRNIAVSKSELNNKLDTTEFNTFKDNVVTKTELAEKGYISDLSNYVTKQELHEATEIDYSNIVTTDELEPYAKKSELPQPYNDSALVSRVTALESKTTNNQTLPANQYEVHGTGMPNGVVTAEIGTTYVDKSKTNGALKWIKTTDGGNQGWEVLIGDTGWRTLNSVSRAGNSFIKIRRVNNLVTYQFGGLQWGWFGVNRRNGPDFVRHNSSGDKGAKVLRPGGIPVGFRSESSLIGGIYSDAGKPYGIWYLGGTSDSNFIQFTFNDPIPTDKDIGDIRVSAISYLTNEPWPTQLP